MNDPGRTRLLQDAYALLAELWCNPAEMHADDDGVKRRSGEVVARLASADRESAALIDRFLSAEISEEEYIDLFELNPRCALYLGSHSYAEPETCAGAAVSDRNEYLIELAGIYRHFGQVPNGVELPDYLPLMVDFLALTCESNADPVRQKFLQEYFIPFLEPLRKRLEELGTHYLWLLDALKRVVHLEQAPAGAA
jgi:nitrate reductase delta subunit